MHRNRRMIIAVALLAFTTTLFAKDAPVRPLPQAVLDAKTIYINNVSGDDRLTARATTELNTWGRFTIVTDKSTADLTLNISTEPAGINDNGDKLATITMQILIPHDDIPQFSSSQVDGIKYLEREVTKIIKILHKRIDEQAGSTTSK